MRPKDWIDKKTKEAALKAFGATQLNNNQETSPYFVGKISADRKKITDPQGRQYNLTFTGNPNQYELAQRLSNDSAYVDARKNKQMNVDGNVRKSLISGFTIESIGEFKEFYIEDFRTGKRYVIDSSLYPSRVALGAVTISLWCMLSETGRDVFMASFPSPNVDSTAVATITCVNNLPSNDPLATFTTNPGFDQSTFIYWSIAENLVFDHENLVVTSEKSTKGTINLRDFWLESPYAYNDINSPFTPPIPPTNPNSLGYYLINIQESPGTQKSLYAPYGFTFGKIDNSVYLYFYSNSIAKSENFGLTTYVLDTNGNVHPPGSEIWRCFSVTWTVQRGSNVGLSVIDVINNITYSMQEAYFIDGSNPLIQIKTNTLFTYSNTPATYNFSWFQLSPKYSQYLGMDISCSDILPIFSRTINDNGIYRTPVQTLNKDVLESAPILMTRDFNISDQTLLDFGNENNVIFPSDILIGKLFPPNKLCIMAYDQENISTGRVVFLLEIVEDPDTQLPTIKKIRSSNISTSTNSFISDLLYT